MTRYRPHPVSDPVLVREDAEAIRPEWIMAARTVGLTAGASAPPHLVDAVAARLAERTPEATTRLLGPARRTKPRDMPPVSGPHEKMPTALIRPIAAARSRRGVGAAV